MSLIFLLSFFLLTISFHRPRSRLDERPVKLFDDQTSSPPFRASSSLAHCFGDVVGLWNVLYTPLSLSRPSFITVIIEVIRRLERSRQTGREKGLCRWLSSLNLYRRRFPPASRSIFSRKPASRSSLLVAGRFSIVTLLECSYISCLFDRCKLGTV